MAKTMAIISDGIVINIIWCSDYTPETDTWKDPGDRPVGIGDIYSDGKWYRDGVEIMTQMETATDRITALETENAALREENDRYASGMTELDAAYVEGVNSI